MPKLPPPNRPSDPLSGVVDRLLAQLPGLQQSEPAAPRVSSSRPIQQTFVGTSAPRTTVTPQGPIVGAWIRLFLALSLGVTMAAWPYLRSCGLPLAGYLVAVGTVVWAGIWAAMAAWRCRAPLAHVLSLIVVVYGLTLSMAEFLPRTGYATNHATWRCTDSTVTNFLAHN